MEWEGKVAGARLVCAVTGQVLAPGETVFSGLVYAEGGFSRRDFSVAGWDQADRSAVLSWWRRSIPLPAERSRGLRLDAATLFTIFSDLKSATLRPQQCFCYVVALCLTRLKRLKFIALEPRDGGTWMLLDDRINRVVYRVRDPHMDAAEESAVQAQLMLVVDAGLSAPAPVRSDRPTESSPSP